MSQQEIILPKFSKILEEWAKVIDGFNDDDSSVSHFNLLNAVTGNLNENAHTRILAALLKIKSVRSFFFNYLERKYPHRGLENVANSDLINSGASVRCFENYIDACIRIGDFCVIIENKVKGACDQPEQIDRYVESIIEQNIEPKNIFVLYITQNGGSPSEESFKKAKEVLEVNGEGAGRFFAISYLQDILPWLYETIGRKVGFELCEPERDMLNSGLVQYANYIEGPDLLGLRDEKDIYTSFRNGVMSIIGGMPLSSVVDLCALAELKVLRMRQQICRTLDDTMFSRLSRKEQRRILNLIFYRSFKIEISDEEFYKQFPINSYGTENMVTSMGVWEDTQRSTVQVDVWCSDKNSGVYEEAFKRLVEEVSKKDIKKEKYKECEYNGKSMIRFRVWTIQDLTTVIELLGGSPCLRKNRISDNGNSSNDDDVLNVAQNPKCDLEEFLRQVKLAVNAWCSRQQISLDTESDLWNIIKAEGCWANHGYGYLNDWAIQLYEQAGEPMRGIDVFPKRGKTMGDIYDLSERMANNGFVCRAMKWDGRVFCRFPTPTKSYAEVLLKSLWEWRARLHGLQGCATHLPS